MNSNLQVMMTSVVMSSLLGKLSRNNFVFSPEERLMYEQMTTDEQNNPRTPSHPKLSILFQHSGTGYCYIKFLAAIDSFDSCDEDILKQLCVETRRSIGPNLEFSDVIMYLMLADDVLKNSDISKLHQIVPSAMDSVVTGGETAGDFAEVNESLPFMRNLLRSKVKFGYTEIGGVVHITRIGYPACSCEVGDQLVCDHGWAMRFILCVFDGRKIGASEVDFNALFSEVIENKPLARFQADLESVDELEVASDTEGICEPTGIACSRADSVIELNSLIDDKNNIIERLAAQVKKLEDAGRPKPAVHRSSANKGVRTELSIRPDDSSSVIGRYEERRKYMNHGTVLTVTKDGINELSPVVEHVGLDTRSKPVRGYMMSEELNTKKMSSDSRIYQINGLANPFRNDKLNFLTHVHTVIDDIIGTTEMSIYEILTTISKKRMSTPTDELVKQVVERTFDLRGNIVISNPFKLPFIEVGMVLTDSCLTKCFTLLKHEFQIEWFKEMKCLRVPKFHSDFRSQNDRTLTLKLGRTHQSSSSPSTTSKSEGRKSGRRKSSIIGF